jgi:hypothetical protein
MKRAEKGKVKGGKFERKKENLKEKRILTEDKLEE